MAFWVNGNEAIAGALILRGTKYTPSNWLSIIADSSI